jgi:predicted dithiol-disulfide oxidoreductase (DUF899 family)
VEGQEGWTLPWVSSYGSDFNYDFQATFDETRGPAEINYRTKVEHEQRGFERNLSGEHPGYSVFLRDGDTIYHTYSTYARGVELLNSSTQFLDLTVLGR